MQQPSAQGIASLYMGNPGALQQRIQQEQKAKPGLPPDLQKMLALQIVTNETDAVKKQKAMDQLQQMGGSQGEPPTVMQTLQQQAEQKAQAQAQQARQQAEQRGLPAAMMGAQGEPAQPVAQPEAEAAGIDQLPAEFQMAGGGIVAFSEGGDKGKYRTRYDAMNDENRKRAEEEAARGDAPLDAQAASDRDAISRILSAIKGGSESAGRAIADVATMAPRGLVGAYDTAVVRPMRAAGINAAYLSPKLTPEGANPESMTPFTDVARARDAANAQTASAATAADNRAALNKADAVSRAEPAAPVGPARAPATPIRDLQQLAAQKAAPAKAAPTATPTAAPAGSTQAAYDDYLKRTLTADRETERAAEEGRFEKSVGRADTTQIDRMMAELEKRKAQFEGPKTGMEGLMEYLGKVAEGGRGRKWYEAGAQGAAGVTALNKERATQQFELTKQGVELAQKKLDADRTYRLDKYKTGQEGAKRVDEIAKETAKEFGLDARNEKTLANQIKVQLLQNQGSLAAANVRASSGAGGDKQQLAELKALQKTLADQMKTTFDKADKQKLQGKLDQVEAAIAQMAGLDTMGAAPGASSPGGIPSDVQALLNKYGGK